MLLESDVLSPCAETVSAVGLQHEK